MGRLKSRATRFVPIDRDTPLHQPPNRRDWEPGDHRVHFIVDAVAAVDLRQVKVNERGTGSEQNPPTRRLALLIYRYATGLFGSGRIEPSTYDRVPVRRLTADPHPDHDTNGAYRRENQARLAESIVKVLQLAQPLQGLPFGQITEAVDGTKVLANASKQSAARYERAGQRIAQLEEEVEQLVAKAEPADRAPRQDGLSIPEGITRRQERKAALEKARTEIEARAPARYAVELAEHEKKMGGRVARKERGERVGGKPPQAPTTEPDSGDPYNVTEPESRIMKAGNGHPFEQSDNAQGAVEGESRLMVGQRVSPSPNDKQALRADLQALPSVAGRVAAVLIDSGFYSEHAVRAVEQTRAGQSSGTLV